MQFTRVSKDEDAPKLTSDADDALFAPCVLTSPILVTRRRVQPSLATHADGGQKTGLLEDGEEML